MAGSGNHSYGMGNDQADEADEAAHGHGGSGGQRCHDQDDPSGGPRIETKGGCLLIAHGQDVEGSDRQQHADGTDHGVGEEEANLAPSGGGEPSEDPGEHLLEGLGVLLLDEGLDGGEEVGHRHAGQDEGGR